jgi:L-iditol 2-dehydrogenase
MKAAIYPGHGKPIVIDTLPDPEPAPGEVIIKVHRCGICGTDLAMTRGESWDYGAGVQFGHEYAGEIVAVGHDVAGLRVGQGIAVLPSLSCGHCAGCDGGNPVMCRNEGGVTAGFAEYARVPARVAIPLPTTLSMADGALVEPLAVSLYGVRRSGIRPGDRVLVLGGGTVALNTIYWARRLGAGRIVALSRSSRRRDLALAMGADSFMMNGENEVAEASEELGGPPHIVYECAGATGMLSRALLHCAVYGKIVSLGFCTAPDPVIPAIGAYKCVTLQFAVGYEMRDFLYIADQMDKGHTDPKAIISTEISLAELPSMMQRLRAPNAETKVHVHPSATS